MDVLQEILVFLSFSGAVYILIKTFFFPKKAKKSCGGSHCGCS